MITTNAAPPEGAESGNDLLTAWRLAHQLRKILPPRIAEAVANELNWAAEMAHLTGRARFLDLAQEVREYVRAAGQEGQ